MEETKICPKCKGEMEEGINVNSVDLGTVVWCTKIKIIKLENPHVIKSFRCKNCGFLESYAK